MANNCITSSLSGFPYKLEPHDGATTLKQASKTSTGFRKLSPQIQSSNEQDVLFMKGSNWIKKQASSSINDY